VAPVEQVDNLQRVEHQAQLVQVALVEVVVFLEQVVLMVFQVLLEHQALLLHLEQAVQVLLVVAQVAVVYLEQVEHQLLVVQVEQMVDLELVVQVVHLAVAVALVRVEPLELVV